MEDDGINENKSDILNDSNFKIQKVVNEDDLGEIVIKLNSLADNEELKVIKGISKNSRLKTIIKKFENNLKNVNGKQLTELANNLYTTGDFVLEDEEYNKVYKELVDENKIKDKKIRKTDRDLMKEAREYARIVTIQNALENIKEVLGSRTLISKVKKFTNSLKAKAKPNSKKSKKVKIKNKEGDEYEVNIDKVEELLEEDKEEKVNNENEIIMEENKVDEEVGATKKKIAEFFKQKKQDKFNKMFKIIDQVNEGLERVIQNAKNMNLASQNKDESFKGMKHYVKDNWNKLAKANVCNCNIAINEYLDDCSKWCNNNTSKNESDSFLINIGVVFKTMLVRINLIEETIKSMVEFMNNSMMEKRELAKFGPGSMIKINQKFTSNRKGQIDFMDKDWNNLSEFQKYKKGFNFTDFKQNVPAAWFNKFSDEEKEEFLKNRIEWQKKRMIQLAEKYKTDPNKYIKFVDTFLFFWNRDKYGNVIKDNKFESILKLDENENIIFNGLKDSLDEASKKGLVYNKLFIKDRYVFSNGLSTEKKLEKIKSRRFQNMNNGKFENRGPGPFNVGRGGFGYRGRGRGGFGRGGFINYNHFPPFFNNQNNNGKYLNNKRVRYNSSDKNNNDYQMNLKEVGDQENNINNINNINNENF